MEKLEHRKDNGFKIGLKHLKDASSLTKSVTKSFKLPSERVERKEEGSLTYTNRNFYETILKIKSVYDTFLCKKNISLFGVGIIGDIGFVLE